VDHAGKYHKLKLKLASKGNPTSKFLDAAKRWNDFEWQAKVESTGQPDEYRVKEPLEVTVHLGTEQAALTVLTLVVGSLLTKIGSEDGDKITVSIGPDVSLSASRFLLSNVPIDHLDAQLKTFTADTSVDVGGVSITIKAGSKLRDQSSIYNTDRVTGFLSTGAIVLPSDTEASIDKVDFEGAKSTDLPIPER
jgi:hypothetical protein